MRRRVLADRNARVLFAGQAMNMFGNTAMIIVLGIWVKDLTGSSGAAGLIFLLLAVSALLAPLSGLLVDRFPRRRVLMINDLLTGILVASLAWVQHRDQVWLIYVVAVLYGISGGVYRAARGGLVQSMVPADLLGEANGLFSSLGQGLRIVAPLAGAGLASGQRWCRLPAGGAGRVRWLYPHAAYRDRLAARLADSIPDAVVTTPEELARWQFVGDGSIGQRRIGEIVLLARGPDFPVPDTAAAFEHGSMTAAEILVPMAIWHPGR